jgi:cellulose synthase/poly-beta-1,6-N-acetylglucosamine synthase-like glycosyltransferase
VLEVPRSGGEVLPIFTKDGLFMPVNYSVLMSVYYKEHPDYLRQSMQSIYDQTVPTDDFVLVCDGPLTPELDAVIADMSAAIRAAPERLPSFEKWRPR